MSSITSPYLFFSLSSVSSPSSLHLSFPVLPQRLHEVQKVNVLGDSLFNVKVNMKCHPSLLILFFLTLLLRLLALLSPSRFLVSPNACIRLRM